MATVGVRHLGGRPPKPPGYWGQKVLAHAAPRHLTYRDMAEALGVSTSTFGQWMSGDARIPAETVEVLADLFGVPTDELRTTPPARSRRRPNTPDARKRPTRRTA